MFKKKKHRETNQKPIDSGALILQKKKAEINFFVVCRQLSLRCFQLLNLIVCYGTQSWKI